MAISFSNCSNYRRARVSLTILTVLSAFLLAVSSQPGVASADSLGIANQTFRASWERTDFPVKEGKTARSWYWGPAPVSAGISENYIDSPGGKRQVQYF